jgi:hypothetical protein
MEEKEHTDRFSHVYPNLDVRPADLKRVKDQPFEFYLVLDLEGMVEILEFPVILINAKTLEVVDRFHRYSQIFPSLQFQSLVYAAVACIGALDLGDTRVLASRIALLEFVKLSSSGA